MYQICWAGDSPHTHSTLWIAHASRLVYEFRALRAAVQPDLSICSGMQEVKHSVIICGAAVYGLSLVNKRTSTLVAANGEPLLAPVESVPVAGKAPRLQCGCRAWSSSNPPSPAPPSLPPSTHTEGGRVVGFKGQKIRMAHSFGPTVHEIHKGKIMCEL